MTKFDRGRRTNMNEGNERDGIQAGRPEPPVLLTTPRRAAWSAAAMLAVVAALFAVAYSINTQPSTPRSASGPQQSPGAAETTGQR
jgi:hypothetical protein